MYLAVAVPLAPALPLLSALLLLIVFLGMLYGIKYVVQAFFGITGSVLGKLPVVGGWINTGVHTVEKKVVGILADAVSAVEAEVGATWHQLGRLVDWVGRELRSHSNLIYTLAAVMLGQEWAGALRHAIADVRAHSNDVAAITRAQIVRIIHAEERLRHGIGNDVLPHFRALDRALDHVRGIDLPRIRARERVLERDVSNLWKWTRGHTTALGALAVSGAVAWALARIGAGWVRCSRSNKWGRNVCGMDEGLLEALIADTLLIVGTLSLVEFAEEMQAVTETAIEPIAHFWWAN